ncbi:MAG: orotate phosphoribosyltransferase [Euryarchaeota archaeon]|nr:orotate phosphoribosyltransferase [Euryarchaeota archaeon]|tara:strand:- start:1436 stop:2041 length:606 start_codon:yes stop_codon:yes gene_type:complete
MGLYMSVPAMLREDARWIRLVDLVRELAFLDGGNDEAFTLASGRTSRWFFDMKPVMMNPEAGRLVGELMNVRCDEIGADFVGGLELGAVPLAALVVATDFTSDRLGFMVRKQAKGRGGRKTNNPPGIEGASIANGGRVIILEDVTTTGGSAIQAVKRIEEETDCEVVAVISILDREEGGREAFEAAEIPFESLLVRSDISG